jgi:hypothetical protein
MSGAGAAAGAGGAARYETVSAELFTLTYGAVVSQVVRDFEDPKEANAQLEAMGYNLGVRIVDDFCAKSRAVRCRSFRETMETLARDALRMYLGVTGVVEAWSADGRECSLRLPDNPLADFVELPPALSELRYSNLLCGAVRGALEMLSMRAECTFVSDALHGDEATVMRVALREVLGEGAGASYKDE